MYEASRLLHLMVGANNTAMTAHGSKYMVRHHSCPVITSAAPLARLSVDLGYRKFAVLWEERRLRGRSGLSVIASCWTP